MYHINAKQKPLQNANVNQCLTDKEKVEGMEKEED